MSYAGMFRFSGPLSLQAINQDRIAQRGQAANQAVLGGISDVDRLLHQLEQNRRRDEENKERTRQWNEDQDLRERREARILEDHKSLLKERDARRRELSKASELKSAALIAMGLDPDTVRQSTDQPASGPGAPAPTMDPNAMVNENSLQWAGDAGAFTSHDPSRVDKRVEELFGDMESDSLLSEAEQAPPPTGPSGVNPEDFVGPPDAYAKSRRFINRYRDQRGYDDSQLSDAELEGVWQERLSKTPKEDPMQSQLDAAELEDRRAAARLKNARWRESDARRKEIERRGRRRAPRPRGSGKQAQREFELWMRSRIEKGKLTEREISGRRATQRKLHDEMTDLQRLIRQAQDTLTEPTPEQRKALEANQARVAQLQQQIDALEQQIREYGNPGQILADEVDAEMERIGWRPRMPDPSSLPDAAPQGAPTIYRGTEGDLTGMSDRLQGMELPQEPGIWEQPGAAPPAAAVPPPGGMIEVTNGRETLRIPASDEASAAAEGYWRVR